MTKPHGKLLILTEPRKDGAALSEYQRGMLDSVLAFTKRIVDPWESIEIASVTGRVGEQAAAAGATEVMLLGKRLSSIIAKVSPLKVQKLSGAMLYGILAQRNGIRWIASPAMSDYTMGASSSWQHASLMGLAYRHLELLRIGLIGWDRPSDPVKYKIVASWDDWLQFRNLLDRAKVVCIDTETRNLQRIGNSLLTIQFGFDGNTGWVLPVGHPESPLSIRELRPIFAELKTYFENAPQAVHVFANAPFDLHQLIDTLKLRWYNHKLWDVQFGAMNLDENTMLREYIGYDKKGGTYSLDRLALEHGMDHYDRTRLGKADRAQLSTKPLNAVAEYGAVDVVLPLRIMKMQIALAKWRNERMAGRPYERYVKTVTEIESMKALQFTFMERQGLRVDTDYIVRLRSNDSDFLKQIREAEVEFLALPGVIETNKRLQEKRHVRAGSLRSESNAPLARVFDPSKRAHLVMLFFEVLKLEPISLNKDGLGATDKAFKKAYKDVPEVAAYADYAEAKTLYATFIVGFYKLLRGMPDNKDGRLRTYFGSLYVKSNRSNSTKPNLQNTPEHKVRAALVKRQFIAKVGYLYFKRDYSAHETRLLGIAARDPSLSTTFYNGMRTRLLYQYQKKILDKELWKRKLWAADVHVQNYGLMHGMKNLEDITKPQRNRYKRIIFGVTYGMGMSSLMVSINEGLPEDQKIDLAATKKTYDDVFHDKFRVSGAWIDRIQSIGRHRILVNNIVGGVRHLWGHLHPEKKVKAAMDRRGPNSAIQGTASNIGFVGGYMTRKLIWDFFTSRGIEIGYDVCNAVHDSTEAECLPVNIPLLGYISEHGYTTMVHRWMENVMDAKLTVGFEMDAKVGATLSEMHDATRWDEQVNAVEAALKWANDQLGWDQPLDLIMPIVRNNAKILYKVRRREIAMQLKSNERVNKTMLMTRDNCTKLGLVFENPKRPESVSVGWRRELEDA